MAETLLFRWSLQWFVDAGVSADLGAVPAVTGAMTVVKLLAAALAAAAAVAYLIVVRSRERGRPEDVSPPDAALEEVEPEGPDEPAELVSV